MKKFLFRLTAGLLMVTAFVARTHAAGGPGNALFFSGGGSSTSVTVPHQPNFNNFPLTVSLYVNTFSFVFGNRVDLVSKSHGDFDGWYVSLMNNQVRANYYGFSGSFLGDGSSGLNGGTINDGMWHQVTFVVDFFGGSLYVDGQLRDSRSWTGGNDSSQSDANLRLGRGDPFGQQFNGLLEEVSVWNVALNAAQIVTNRGRSLTGLEPGLSAYYRLDEDGVSADSAPAFGMNNGGWIGGVSSVPSTLLPFTPFVESSPATAVGATDATMNGRVNPEGTNTFAWFEWGTSTNYGNATAPQVMGNNSTELPFSRALTGLAAGVTYYYRAAASNSLGLVYGTNVTFTTIGAPPTVTTLSATEVSPTGARLHGVANPGGNATAVWFEWDAPGVQLTSTPAQNMGSGTNQTNFSFSLSGLNGGVTYRFRAVASNIASVVTGSFLNFTTPRLPLTTTLSANNLGLTNATLNGLINPNGVSTFAWFDWGTTTSYGNRTPLRPIGNGTNFVALNELVTGLTNGTSYHFRLVASNSVGVVFGQNETFTLTLFSLVTNLNYPATGQGFSEGVALWADFNNDGRLDALAGGRINTTTPEVHAGIWYNLPSGFVASNFWDFALAAADDFDRNGWIDLVALEDVGSNRASLFLNVGGVLTNTGAAGVSFFYRPTVVDLNMDGLPDILSGLKVYTTHGRGFELSQDLGSPVLRAATALGDFNRDGRLDFIFGGISNSTTTTRLWNNVGNGFLPESTFLGTLLDGDLTWGDFDNDGDLDVLAAGSLSSNTNFITQVWENVGGAFFNNNQINAPLPGVASPSVSWADFDNDGRLDMLIAGMTNQNANSVICQLWRNTGTNFVLVQAGFPGITSPATAWGDFDGDGRLDLLLTGQDQTGALLSQIWRNNSPQTNRPPAAPTGLSLSVSNNVLYFSWNPASDPETAAAGLTYNLRVGTTPGGSELVSPLSASNGLRRVSAPGNAGYTTFALRNFLLNQNLYWSVQAVDTGRRGGPFAPEQSVRIFLQLSASPSGQPPLAGDTNGDGVLSESEFAVVLNTLNGNGIVSESALNLVLSNYWPHSRWLQMTNVAGLGQSNVTFSLTNSVAGSFSVETSTNLQNWIFLGPAQPRFLFTDTNAPSVSPRYYRLRRP